MEVKNRLLNFNDMYIYQNDEGFTFSLDSVLLANFVKINKRDKKIIDFCTGNAPVPLILSTKTKDKIIGIEIQKDVSELAMKSIAINNLSQRIKIINDDVKNVSNLYESDSFDIITCNPPYFKTTEDGYFNVNKSKMLARHEICLSLEDIFKQARKILKNGKKIAIVHRIDRFVDIIVTMKKYNIEPKRVRFCYPKVGKEANIVLVEGVKNGKTGLKILPNLIIHNADGTYTDEVKNMFEEE